MTGQELARVFIVLVYLHAVGIDGVAADGLHVGRPRVLPGIGEHVAVVAVAVHAAAQPGHVARGIAGAQAVIGHVAQFVPRLTRIDSTFSPVHVHAAGAPVGLHDVAAGGIEGAVPSEEGVALLIVADDGTFVGLKQSAEHHPRGIVARLGRAVGSVFERIADAQPLLAAPHVGDERARADDGCPLLRRGESVKPQPVELAGEGPHVGRLAGRPGVDDVVGGHAVGGGFGAQIAEVRPGDIVGRALEEVAAGRHIVDEHGAFDLHRTAKDSAFGTGVAALFLIVDAGGQTFHANLGHGGLVGGVAAQGELGVVGRSHDKLPISVRALLPRLTVIYMVAHVGEREVGSVRGPCHVAAVGHGQHAVRAVGYGHGERLGAVGTAVRG